LVATVQKIPEGEQDMRTAGVAFLLALVTGALFTPLARRLAHRIGAMDHALSSRKVHKAPIPRLGGIAIVGAFYAPLVGLLFTDSSVGRLFFADERKAIGLLVGGAVIAVLGIYDDLKGAGAAEKFVVQFAVAGFVYWAGFRIDELASPFGASVELGWLGLPFTMLWITGIVNAINLTDGLDGLAGGVAFVSVLTTFVAAAMHGELLMALTTAALAGAILGFLWYNFNPASIFMGDTGSMFLGFVLATSAIESHHKSEAAVAIIVPVVALGLPIIDTLLAIVRRALRGSPLFRGDREHIHHRLLALGLSHRRAVLVLYGASVALGLVALAIASASGLETALVLFALALSAGLLLRHLGYMRFERARKPLELRRRNLELRRGVREIGDRLRHAAEVEHVWEWVKAAAPVLGAACVSLRVVEQGTSDDSRVSHFAEGFERAGSQLLKTQHSLLGERPDAGVLELGWVDGRKQIDRDTEIAVELLCEHVLHALSRIQEAAVASPGVGSIQATALGASARGGSLERGSLRGSPPGADTPGAR
jgi:UDP-GlcNAc:undecaprenyl-phosphate GlcNAc-1-phosphate transferase